MEYCASCLVLLWLINGSSASDIVAKMIEDSAVGPPSPDWESLNFWLATSVLGDGLKCKEFSDYYCLDAYITQVPTNLTQIEQFSLDLEVGYDFEKRISMEWRHINMFNPNSPGQCCLLQTNKFMLFGYHNNDMSPEEYLSKLSDYSDESRPLNNLAASYDGNLCSNVISEIGFGPGALRRVHASNVKEGAPYMIIGGDYFYGIPGFPSMIIDYNNPGSQLTFHWFKNHIMCQDHPSICGQNSPRRHERKREMKKHNKTKGGKKARRNKEEKMLKEIEDRKASKTEHKQ